MADDEYPPEAGDNVTFLDMHKPTGRKRKGRGGGKGGGGDDGGDDTLTVSVHKKRIPVLPPLNIEASEIDLAGDVTQKDAAAVNMRIVGASWQKIAAFFGDGMTATEAKKRVIRALAKTHPEEDWETLRLLEIARADQLLEQTMAMAAADYFVDLDDPEHLIPNEDKLRWNAAAQSALALHATITGAKAPVRMEITPSDQEYAILVQKMLEIEGKAPPKEYDILDVEEIPDEPSGPE